MIIIVIRKRCKLPYGAIIKPHKRDKYKNPVTYRLSVAGNVVFLSVVLFIGQHRTPRYSGGVKLIDILDEVVDGTLMSTGEHVRVFLKNGHVCYLD